MTKSNTKRALLSSVLAMILCLGLLIGTTFAWFTDSVTSSGNKIKAGTLDIQLLMDGDVDGTYDDISNNNSPIFGEGSIAQNNNAETLWEPGKTQIVYLAVENKGNLDLKYNIALNVVDGGLIGSLEYAIIDGAKYGDIDVNNVNSWAALKANAQTGDVVAGTTVAAPNGAITVAEKIEYFALAVHMKEDADNKYQGKDITIDVTVLATQLASEYDSFGNQYDANAWGEVAEAPVPDAEGAVNVWTAEQLAGVMSNVKGIKTINIMENIDLSGRTWVPANLWDPENTALLTINGNGHTISNMAVASAGKGGFIGSNSRNITINDLTFKTASVTASGNFAGTVIGYAYGNITLNNVDVVDSVISGTAEFSIRIGGLIGFVPQDGGTLTLTNCDVTGSTVSGYHNVGAMVGATMTKKTVTIESCTATNNTLMYASSNVGAFAFGASTSGYTEYVPASGFDAENNKVVKVVTVTNATELTNALENAKAGTVITLTEDVNYGTVTVDELKDVVINGAEGSPVIFKTDANSKIENVTLQEVEFEYTGATVDCGIVIDANAQIDNLVIEGCTFNGTGAKAGRGLSGNNNNASIVLRNCTFEDLGYPIYVWGSYKSLTIEGCTFKNIKSWAIMPQGGFDGDLTVNNCNFVDCLGGGLIKAGTLTAGHTFTFTNNTITGCTIAGDHNWFQFNVSAGTTVIENNTKDGQPWTPGVADGLK